MDKRRFIFLMQLLTMFNVARDCFSVEAQACF